MYYLLYYITEKEHEADLTDISEDGDKWEEWRS